MKTFKMETIGDKPALFGLGQNTIRLCRGRYEDMNAGDRVVMLHKYSKESPAYAVESFFVSRIVVGSLEGILDAIWFDNVAAPESPCEMTKILEKFYGFDEIYDDTMLIAIY